MNPDFCFNIHALVYCCIPPLALCRPRPTDSFWRNFSGTWNRDSSRAVIDPFGGHHGGSFGVVEGGVLYRCSFCWNCFGIYACSFGLTKLIGILLLQKRNPILKISLFEDTFALINLYL